METHPVPALTEGWASNFGRSLLDLDIFRDRVVLEYFTIKYPTRHFADALDRSSFTRFHLIFRVKWKSRVKLDFTRYYSACSTIEFRGQVHSTIKYSNPTFFKLCRLDYLTRLDSTRLDFWDISQSRPWLDGGTYFGWKMTHFDH